MGCELPGGHVECPVYVDSGPGPGWEYRLHPCLQMRLVTALLVKNEADRYLRSVLERCRSFSDEVLVLDDGSTDDTVHVAESLGCLVKQRPQSGMWGNESRARAELWERGAKLAKDGWLLICDADMLLEGNPRDLIDTWDVSAWAFVLWDCWD